MGMKPNETFAHIVSFGRDYVDLDLVFPDPKGAVFNPENQSKRSISAKRLSGSRESGSTISATRTRHLPAEAGWTSRISRSG